MADVNLNLIYNDNGTSVAVNSLVNQLHGLESKQHRINIDSSSLKSFGNDISKVSKEIEDLKNKISYQRGIGGVFGSTFNQAENSVRHFENSLKNTSQTIVNLEIRLKALQNIYSEVSWRKLPFPDVSDLKNSLEGAIDSARTALSRAHLDLRIDQESLAISKKFKEEFEKTLDYSFDDQVNYYGNLNKLAKQTLNQLDKDSNEWVSKEEKMMRGIAQGQSQFWSGIQRTATATINSIKEIYAGFRNYVEAPLNLTGVSSLVSMLESMEGSLILGRITSNITEGFSRGVERFDILQSYPAVLQGIGYSAKEAQESMDRLYQSVLGLPTSFSDIIDMSQQFTLLLGDLGRATDLAIAANNAFVASGSTGQQVTAGMRQLMYLIEGTKLRSTQWYTLIRSMPIALREVGKALGYVDFPSFTNDLREGAIETDVLIDKLIEVGLHSETLGTIIDVMKNRVQAALTNVGNAAQRMGNTFLEALDETLRATGGKGIAENIKGVSSIIDHITQIGAQWIRTHGAQIQALIDKFMSIDWASVIPSFFEGLVKFANNALNNIGTYISEIGGIITEVRQLFNDFENSRFLAGIQLFSTSIKDALSIGGGLAQIVAGYKLASGKIIPISAGGVAAGGVAAGGGLGTGLAMAGAGVLTGLELYWLGDLLYNIGEYGWAEGVKNATVTPYASAIPTQFLELIKNAYEDDYQKRLTKHYVELPGITDNETQSVLKLYKEMQDAQKLYDEALSEYTKRLEAVDLRRQRVEALIEELQKETDSWEYLDSDYFEKIYGQGGFLSQQVSKASGWLYRNTTQDFINVQREFSELLPEVNDSIISAIDELATPEEKSKALEAWANVLNNLNPTDPESIAKLKTMQTEGGESIVSTLLLPQYEADEVLSTNKDKIKELRLETLEAIGEPLDDEEEKIIKEIENDSAVAKAGAAYEKAANEMSEKYMPGIRSGLYQFSNDVINAIEEMINNINNRQFRIVPDVIYRNPQIEPPQRGVYSANGGFMFAPRGTDTIPAMLTPGEFVQRRAAVEHFGREFMSRINQLDLNGALRSLRIAVPYATGGIVKNDSRSYRDNHAVVNQTFNHSSGNFGLRRANRFVRALG